LISFFPPKISHLYSMHLEDDRDNRYNRDAINLKSFSSVFLVSVYLCYIWFIFLLYLCLCIQYIAVYCIFCDICVVCIFTPRLENTSLSSLSHIWSSAWKQNMKKKNCFTVLMLIAIDEVSNYKAFETETCGGKLAPVWSWRVLAQPASTPTLPRLPLFDICQIISSFWIGLILKRYSTKEFSHKNVLANKFCHEKKTWIFVTSAGNFSFFLVL